MNSKNLSQLDLLGSVPPPAAEVSDELLARQPTLTAAINLCVNASGLQDKEIYLPLKIDPGHWTRIRHGQAHFPLDQLDELQNLCGNEIPLRWQALRRGYRLVPMEDAKDAQLRVLERRNAELQGEIDTLMKYGVIQHPRR